MKTKYRDLLFGGMCALIATLFISPSAMAMITEVYGPDENGSLLFSFEAKTPLLGACIENAGSGELAQVLVNGAGSKTILEFKCTVPLVGRMDLVRHGVAGLTPPAEVDLNGIYESLSPVQKAAVPKHGLLLYGGTLPQQIDDSRGQRQAIGVQIHLVCDPDKAGCDKTYVLKAAREESDFYSSLVTQGVYGNQTHTSDPNCQFGCGG